MILDEIFIKERLNYLRSLRTLTKAERTEIKHLEAELRKIYFITI
jgi:hypothetical protein